MIIDVVLWIIFGALSGWIASIMAGVFTGHKLLASIAVGIIGAFAGGVAVRLITGIEAKDFTLNSPVMALLGAIILLTIVRMLQGNKAHHA